MIIIAKGEIGAYVRNELRQKREGVEGGEKWGEWEQQKERLKAKEEKG